MNQTKQQPSHPEQSGEIQPEPSQKPKMILWIILAALAAIIFIGWVVWTYQKTIQQDRELYSSPVIIRQTGQMNESTTAFRFLDDRFNTFTENFKRYIKDNEDLNFLEEGLEEDVITFLYDNKYIKGFRVKYKNEFLFNNFLKNSGFKDIGAADGIGGGYIEYKTNFTDVEEGGQILCFHNYGYYCTSCADSDRPVCCNAFDVTRVFVCGRVKDMFKDDYHTSFNPNTVKVGDIVSLMEVVSINPYRDDRMDLWPDQNMVIQFSGPIWLIGEYNIADGDSFYPAGTVYFTVTDSQHDNKIPHAEGTNSTTFIFSNQDFAKEKFNKDQTNGHATIVIDNLIYKIYPSMVTNEAELIQIEKIN